MPRSKCFVATLMVFVFLCAAVQTAGAGPDKIALKAGRIIPVIGEEIENGIILIEHGKIKAMGKDLDIPYDFWLLDASNQVVFPGMIEAFTSSGLDRANETLPVVPFLNVYDAIDPSSLYFEDALRDGITTMLISQGANTVIGAIARAVKPIGMTVDEMTVQEEAGIIVSFKPMSGSDHMIQMATFRSTFRELEDYRKKLAEGKYEKKLEDDGKTIDVGPEEAVKRGRELIRDEDYDFKHFNLVRLTEGRLKAYLYCAAPLDVVHAIKTAREHGFLKDAVFVLENECYKAVELLKAAGRPVILDAGMVYTKTDPLTGDEKEIFVPKVFYKAGIPFAIRSSSGGAFGTRYLWYQAARLIRNGVPRETAIQSITVNPAAFIGLEERIGALKPGMDANILILSGDPLDAGTWVEKSIIDGKVVYEREKDYRLEELMTGQEHAPEKTGEKKDGAGSKDEE